MICKQFGDYDIYKWKRQPVSWIKAILEHMQAEAAAVSPGTRGDSESVINQGVGSRRR
jgi:hypothetical protein